MLNANGEDVKIRKAGISEQTLYRWKAKYAGLEVDVVRKMAQLQEENMRLKQLVAVRLSPVDRSQCLSAIRNRLHLPRLFKKPLKILPHVRVVIGYKNAISSR